MNWQRETDKIVKWLRQQVHAAGANGLVIGLSGGIDSSVAAAICKKAFPQGVIGLIMPCHSMTEDTEHGQLIAEKFEIKSYTIDLTISFTNLLETYQMVTESKPNQLTIANIKPRLRMTTLYYYAGLFNYLVAGTGNKSEIEIGYFTKYGDGGVDLEPIGHLLKTDVKELAKFLGIPPEIIEKEPSAGLWEGQTDETEMGMTYGQLDEYLKTGMGTREVQTRVQQLQHISQHKRNLPPVPTDIL